MVLRKTIMPEILTNLALYISQFQPAIQRITNFWANGTWKGPKAKLGAYWHQDAQFWEKPKHNVLSILHAQKTPPSGGETGFADLRAAYATLSKPLLERAANASIHVSVRDIGDFAKGTEEDLAAFPDAEHPILDIHCLDGGPLLYVGSPHMKVGGLESPEAGRALLDMLIVHATSPSLTYFHAWDAGDVIVWDNTQTLHHAMPYNNDGTAQRELYRTQARLRLGEGTGTIDAREEL
jgi:taurine dioxygenase